MSSSRVIGIVRVSEIGDRTQDSLRSPREQAAAMEAFCEAQGWELVRTVEELDVSGTLPIGRRPHLEAALEDLETGRAEVLLTHYFDRLVRGMARQSELIERVEAIDGADLWSVDYGRRTNQNAAGKMTVNAQGMVSQYVSDAAKERSWAAVEAAIAEGVGGFSKIPLGYLLGDDRRLVLDPARAPIVAEAFELRARGATLREVQELLAGHGVARAVSAVRSMLASRVYLGELHFGDHTPNLAAHRPIVSEELWRRVQRVTGPSTGPRPESDRLLARLGVLRCGSCGARMVVGTSNGYPIYRCPAYSDCEHHVAISARIAEGEVERRVREAVAEEHGQASALEAEQEAASATERARAELDAAIEAFAPVADIPAARDRLAELREALDAATEREDSLRGSAASMRRVAGADWDVLTLAERRDLITAVISTVVVSPSGRGAGRLAFEFVLE